MTGGLLASGAQAALNALAFPPLEPTAQRILLRLPNWLGDIVMAAPAVHTIAKAHPHAHIVASAPAPFLPLAALLPGVSETMPSGRDRRLVDLRASRRRLRACEFDLAVVFPRSTRAAIAPFLTRIPVRLGLGVTGRRRLLTHSVEHWKPLRTYHRSAYYAAVGRPFGDVTLPAWRAAITNQHRDAAHAILLRLGRDPAKPLVVLEPGASYGSAKCWSADHFGELARRAIHDLNCDVLTIGTAPSLAVEHKIASIAGSKMLRGVGKTPDVGALMGVIASADVVVSNDTGPMHVAAALGIPLVAIFGATDPVVSSPNVSAACHLIYDPESCSPCFLRTCPIPGHPCLTKISPERVLHHVALMLE